MSDQPNPELANENQIAQVLCAPRDFGDPPVPNKSESFIIELCIELGLTQEQLNRISSRLRAKHNFANWR